MPVLHRCPRLIGRDRELEALLQAVGDARRGAVRAVVVSGEAGIGKSRLLEELLRRAGDAGARTLVGRCVRLDTCTLPFGPFLEVLAQVRPPDAATAELLRAVEGALGLPDPQADGEPVEQLARTRVFGLMVRLLTGLGRSAPLVLVVEDVHWADASSLDLVRFLLAGLHDVPVLLVVSYRTDELAPGSPRLLALSELGRDRRCLELRLTTLGPADVGALVAELLDAPADPPLARAVEQRSDGNPLYVEELLAAGFPEADLDDTRLRGLLLAKVLATGPAARQVLSLIAVAGGAADHAVLEAAWDGDEAALSTGLREALSRHLLVQARDGDSWAFRHALVRDAVLGELLPGERRRLHDALARALDAAPTRSSATVVDVAAHWYEAGRWPQALRAGLDAARSCTERHGFTEASSSYERVLQLWDRVDQELRPAVVLSDLLAEAADAARLAGDPATGERLLRRALAALADGDREGEAALHERLGRCLWEAGDTARAAAVCARGAALLQDAPASPLHARLLAAHGRMLMLLGDFGASAAVCDAALAMARAVGEPTVELTGLITCGVDAVMTGDVERGLAVLRDSCRLAVRGSGLDDLVRAYGNLAAALGRLCRFEQSLAAADEGLVELERRGLPTTVAGLLLTNACESLVALGRWDEADARLSQALSCGLPLSHEPFLHRMRAELETARGRWARAQASLDTAQRLGAQLHEPQYVAPYLTAVATLAAERGEHAPAQQAVAAALEAAAGSAQEDVAVLACLVGLRAAADEAARLRLLRRPELEQVLRDGDGVWERAQALAHGLQRAGGDLPDCGAALVQCRAEHARLHDRDDAALWADAVEAWRVPGKPYAVACAQQRQGECLLRARQVGAAGPVLREALDVAERLGAAPLRERVLELARRGRLDLAGPPPPRHPPAPVAGALTARERQVLEWLARGRTNREIASGLFISLKTVDNHVTHVLDKLQARNRVEAVAAGLRLGLLAPQEDGPDPTPVPIPPRPRGAARPTTPRRAVP